MSSLERLRCIGPTVAWLVVSGHRLFPEPQVYDHGLLDVGEGNLVYWETRGNPHGRPALVVHGGPGSGRRRGAHKGVDPEAFQVVLFDQRGCGDSKPLTLVVCPAIS